MSADEPTTTELVAGLDRCEQCGDILPPGPGGAHTCNTSRGTVTATERRALREADDRPRETVVVTGGANANGSPRAYHKRRAPVGPPEPGCRVIESVGTWVETTLGQAPIGGYPCRWCWPEFREVLDS